MTGQLATKPETGGKAVEGFCTPKEDGAPQKMTVPPKRVIPIVFLPGIMGSNLRMNQERQQLLKKSNNIAWRPDRLREAVALINQAPALRQLQLDADSTEVDIYQPGASTGSTETAGDRHDHDIGHLRRPITTELESSLLMDDPAVLGTERKTKEQKARERGWGEVYFSSYRTLLELCEEALNEAIRYGRISPYWQQLIGVSPRKWRANAEPPLSTLTEADVKQALQGCWFPVHAMGYNWLESNETSGVLTAKRVSALIAGYTKQGYRCEKVILVTHSMGGLVARALIHPEMGNIADKVLGVVHGVMPAIGAPAAYRRMRCGFEESYLGVDPAPKVLGNYGAEVTAVLGNSEGGLQLLPSDAYGNHWLQAWHGGTQLLSLPRNGDPYEEIYKARGKWYGLLREAWINPANQASKGYKQTCLFLDNAKAFHQKIAKTYHPRSYAHYGADPNRPSWEHVAWELLESCSATEAEGLQISEDDQQGKLFVHAPGKPKFADFTVKLRGPSGPGDQTVPLRSAEHQLNSGKFSGIFRQIGYEHQGSYQDENALAATLFSLVRIAQTMRWSAP